MNEGILEGDNLRPRGTFDDDPTTIPIPPNPEKGQIQFRTILEKGVPITLDDGKHYTPIGIIMSNFTKKTGYINARMKDGYVIISLIKSDEE